jgi:hypothetical protein
MIQPLIWCIACGRSIGVIKDLDLPILKKIVLANMFLQNVEKEKLNLR